MNVSERRSSASALEGYMMAVSCFDGVMVGGSGNINISYVVILFQ